MKRLLVLAAVVALGGCQAFVDPDQGCDPAAASPCPKPGYVCTADRICVEASGASGSSGSSGSAGSSGASGSSSGGSSGGADFGRYGAAAFAIPPMPGGSGSMGPPTPYYVGGSIGDPKDAQMQADAFEIADAGGAIAVSATGVSLATARSHAMAAFIGAGVLVVGGETGPGTLATSSELSPTTPGGALASFESSSLALVTNRLAGAMVFVPPAAGTQNTFVYVVGGLAPGRAGGLDSEVAPISGRDAGAFVSIGAPLPRAYMGVVQVGSALYAVGGVELYSDGGSTPARSVLSAAIYGDGGLGDWADTGVATAQPHVEGAVYTDMAGGQKLVVAGGLTDLLGPGHTPQALGAIEVASFSGTLGAFADGGQLQTARGGFVGGVLGSSGYAVGGVVTAGGGVVTTQSVETYDEP